MTEFEWLNNCPYSFIHEEINRNVFLAWVDEFNIEKTYSGLPLWPKMFGKKYQKIKELSDYELIPFVKQQEMYERLDGSRVLAVHFYENIPLEVLDEEISVFAYERGLSVDWFAYDESWYNPGVSITAVFEINDLERYLKYIEIHRQYDGKANKHYI